MVLVVVDIKEIDDHADPEPIHKIANGAREYQAKGERGERMTFQFPMTVEDDEPDR